MILMVPDTPDVEAVLFGAERRRRGPEKGTLVIDMSSISPIETKDLPRRSTRKAATTWTRRSPAAKSAPSRRRLTIMVGGPTRAFERAKPLFEKMGKNITHVGDRTAPARPARWRTRSSWR